MLTPRDPAPTLSEVSIKKLPGLNSEDVRELEDLGYGSIQAVLDEADRLGGNFTRLSTTSIVIDRDQSHRIAAALLASDLVPATWKSKWNPVTSLSDHQSNGNVATPPAQQPAEPRWYERLFAGFNS